MPPRKGFSTHRDFASHVLGVVGDWDEETASSLYLNTPEYWQLAVVPMKKKMRRNDGTTVLACVCPNGAEGATKPLLLLVCSETETIHSFIRRGILTLDGEELFKVRGKPMTANEIVAEGWIVD